MSNGIYPNLDCRFKEFNIVCQSSDFGRSVHQDVGTFLSEITVSRHSHVALVVGDMIPVVVGEILKLESRRQFFGSQNTPWFPSLRGFPVKRLGCRLIRCEMKNEQRNHSFYSRIRLNDVRYQGSSFGYFDLQAR